MRRSTGLFKVVLCLCLQAALQDSSSAVGQSKAPSEWTWAGGANLMYQPGIYGSQGTSSTNNIPGSRSSAATWIDGTGDLWLFGGFGVPASRPWGTLNDLWKFHPANRQWTWMAGSTMADAQGAYGAIATMGIGNIPGARINATSLIDKSGKFWLLQGFGIDSTGANGLLNDVWKFDPSTNEWAWMGGSNVSATGQTGVYGTLGAAAAGNIPGARESVARWADSNGRFWFFGGLP
jgi:Galactose oxidase, central domain